MWIGIRLCDNRDTAWSSVTNPIKPKNPSRGTGLKQTMAGRNTTSSSNRVNLKIGGREMRNVRYEGLNTNLQEGDNDENTRTK